MTSVTPQKVMSSVALSMAETRSLAAVRARNLALSLAGRARALYELATGSSAADDGGATPRNPQGAIGCDLSGPPFGPAPIHPLWVYEALTDQTGIVGEAPSFTPTEVDEVRYIRAYIYVRPHVRVRGDEPYTRGYFVARYANSTGVGTATADVGIYRFGERDRRQVITLSTASALGSDSAMTAWVPLAPGINTVVIEIQQTSAITSPLVIAAMSINQIVSRTH